MPESDAELLHNDDQIGPSLWLGIRAGAHILPVEYVEEPVKMHWEMAAKLLEGKKAAYYDGRTEGAVAFRDLEFGVQHGWLTQMTRGTSGGEKMIAEMPRGARADFGQDPKRERRLRIASGGMGSEGEARAEGAGRERKIGGRQERPTKSDSASARVRERADSFLDVLPTEAAATSTVDAMPPCAEGSGCNHPQYEWRCFNLARPQPGWNAPPYANLPHTSLKPVEGSQGVRRAMLALEATRHLSKDRRSSAQTHMDELEREGIKVLRDRTGDRADFQAVGGLNSMVADFKSGTMSLFADREFKELCRLEKRLRDARKRDA
ncbi:hypothetical protein LTR65_008004 [Meristemomyces frigidus]